MAEKNRNNLPSPPEGDYVRYIPLGGLDEVGMNCSIIECNGSMLLVDCGLTFPEHELGVDIILPDWSYVIDNLDRLDGVLLTHGHEDHIGALPFFLEEVDVPVYSGRLTLAMLQAKLGEHNLEGEVELVPVEPGDVLEIGPFEAEFIHVTHSVPNAMAIALHTPLGSVMFTGDWKFDQTPLIGETCDLQRLARLGDDGLLALFADSTNSGTPGYSRSERAVKAGIGEVMESVPGRLIIAQFSSNLERVGAILDEAHRHGKKVLLLGRSLMRNFGLAREQGFIELPSDDLLVNPKDLDRVPDKQLVIISTGSQAEPRASLTRMGHGDHRWVSVEPSDTIILSARMIPGNERGIQNMINNLTKLGATVLTADDGPIHATGHAKREEMKLMINLTRPKYLVPVHGEYRMRKRHAEIGVACGVPEQLVIEDGDVLEFDAKGARVVGHVHTGRVMVDGRQSGTIEDVAVRDRAKLAHSGIIVAFTVIDRDRGDLTTGPDLVQRGFLSEEDAGLLDEASSYALQAVNNLSKQARRDPSEVSEAIRAAIRRYFRKNLDRKPVVIPIVHEA